MEIDESNGSGMESVALDFEQREYKKFVFMCFICKKYIQGSSSDLYDHVCDNNRTENNDLIRCMRVVINALYETGFTDISTSTINFPESPSLRSSRLELSSIPASSPCNDGLHRFVTSTPKEADSNR